MKNGNISVFIIDDHSVVREGYKRLLEKTEDIRVIGEARDGEEVGKLLLDLLPDIVIMDINLPRMGGIEVARRILLKIPHQKILMFSMHEDVVFVTRSMQAGAKGYVTKSSAPEVLVEAVRSIANGRLYIEPSMAEELALQLGPQKSTRLDTLSAREFEIFKMLVEGYSVNEISNVLYQSVIKNKLDASNAAQIIRIGLEHGMLSTRDSDFSQKRKNS